MRRALASIAAVLVLQALPARAQDAPAAKEPAPLAKAYYVDADVFLTGHYVRERQKTPDVTFRERWSLFEEGGSLQSKGYLLDPNICEWRMDLLLGASEEHFASHDTGGGEHNQAIGGYDIAGLFYKDKPVSVRAFAEDNTTNRDRDFARSIRYREARQDAEVTTKGDFPVSMLVEWIQQKETSDLRETHSRTGHYRASVTDGRNPDWLTELSFDHRDRRETAEYTPWPPGRKSRSTCPPITHGWPLRAKRGIRFVR